LLHADVEEGASKSAVSKLQAKLELAGKFRSAHSRLSDSA